MKEVLQYLSGGIKHKADAKKTTFLIWGGVILFSANGFAFFNYMPKHDALNHMFSSAGEWELRLGRFFQPFYTYLRGNVVSPWLVGMIGAVFSVMSALIIVDIMNIKNSVYKILASGFLVANLSVTELCGIYLYIYDCCMIALFFACLSVCCWLYIRHPWNIAFGAVCLVLSMGFYQAYISVTIVLCVVIILQKALENACWKEELNSVFSMVMTIGIGGIAYLALYKILLFWRHTAPTDGSNGMGQLTELSVGMIIQNIVRTYKDVLNFFVTDSRYFGKMICALHGVLLLIILIGFVVLLFEKRIRLYNIFMAVFIFSSLPVWCNFTSVLQGENIVLRSSYALYLFFPIGFMIMDEISHNLIRKPMQYLTGVICLFLLIRNVQYSNTVYMYARVTYDRTVSIMTRVLEDIEEYEGYEIGVTPIAVIGQFSKNDHVEVYQGDYKFINGYNKTSTTYPQTTYNFWRSMGSPINGIQDNDILRTYSELDQVRQMPCYPYDGYCKMFGDTLVVKIADE